MTSGLIGYTLLAMQAARQLPQRLTAPWEVESQIEIEKTRAQVVATRRFLDEMRARMRGRQSRRLRSPGSAPN